MINLITPLYRYSNLKIVYSSIVHQTDNFNWFLIEGSHSIKNENIDFLKNDERVKFFKINTEYTWGHEQRNFFIKNIKCDDKDWCYFLDDDNIITNDLIIDSINEYETDYGIILFSQKQGLTEKMRLYGYEGHLKLGTCDIGSFIIRYGLLKNTFIYGEGSRNSDGHYCEQIASIPNVKIKYSDGKFVRYNALSLDIY